MGQGILVILLNLMVNWRLFYCCRSQGQASVHVIAAFIFSKTNALFVLPYS